MLTIDKLETIFTLLGKVCEKPVDLVVCGGVSIMLNYGTRPSTMDVDCLAINAGLVPAITEVTSRLYLPKRWINTDVTVTLSYSDKLTKYKKLYKTYGNLTVHTITGLPLLCMKLISWRPNTSDYNDCVDILDTMRDVITVRDIMNTIMDIYGDTSILSVSAQQFIDHELNNGKYTLDNDSVESIVYAINGGLLKLEDVAKEFKDQITYALAKGKCGKRAISC